MNTNVIQILTSPVVLPFLFLTFLILACSKSLRLACGLSLAKISLGNPLFRVFFPVHGRVTLADFYGNPIAAPNFEFVTLGHPFHISADATLPFFNASVLPVLQFPFDTQAIIFGKNHGVVSFELWGVKRGIWVEFEFRLNSAKKEQLLLDLALVKHQEQRDLEEGMTFPLTRRHDEPLVSARSRFMLDPVAANERSELTRRCITRRHPDPAPMIQKRLREEIVPEARQLGRLDPDEDIYRGEDACQIRRYPPYPFLDCKQIDAEYLQFWVIVNEKTGEPLFSKSHYEGYTARYLAKQFGLTDPEKVWEIWLHPATSCFNVNWEWSGDQKTVFQRGASLPQAPRDYCWQGYVFREEDKKIIGEMWLLQEKDTDDPATQIMEPLALHFAR